MIQVEIIDMHQLEQRVWMRDYFGRFVKAETSMRNGEPAEARLVLMGYRYAAPHLGYYGGRGAVKTPSGRFFTRETAEEILSRPLVLGDQEQTEALHALELLGPSDD